jgi:hypothetical protein
MANVGLIFIFIFRFGCGWLGFSQPRKDKMKLRLGLVLVLSSLVFPVLPCLALPCLFLYCVVLPYLALPCLVLTCLSQTDSRPICHPSPLGDFQTFNFECNGSKTLQGTSCLTLKFRSPLKVETRFVGGVVRMGGGRADKTTIRRGN